MAESHLVYESCLEVIPAVYRTIAASAIKYALIPIFVLISAIPRANAAVTIQNLCVEYRNTPLGIDVAQPRFGWQMAATAGERGLEQTAYQLEVKDPKGAVIWDSQRVPDAASLGIKYAGPPLKGSTRYAWTVSVWNQAGAKLSRLSWFETGLMDPSPTSAPGAEPSGLAAATAIWSSMRRTWLSLTPGTRSPLFRAARARASFTAPTTRV